MKKSDRGYGGKIMGYAIDYSKYKMNAKELIMGYIIGFGVAFMYVNVIFHKPEFALVTGAVAGIIYLFFYRKKCIEKRNKLIVKQFKELMESLVASYASGGNHVSAFETAYNDMEDLYGRDGWITREVNQINTGIKNGMTTESLLRDFAKRVGNEDITNFVDVFSVCIRQGGDIKKVLYDTRTTIIEKMEMEDEISVALRSSYNEFLVLTVIPIVVDTFMQMDSAMKAVGTSGIGIISRMIAVILCMAAYKLSRKIVHRVEVLFD